MSFIKRQSSVSSLGPKVAETFSIVRASRLSLGAAPSFPGSTIPFLTQEWVHPTFEHSISSQQERVTVRKSGIYRFHATLQSFGGTGVTGTIGGFVYYVRNVTTGGANATQVVQAPSKDYNNVPYAITLDRVVITSDLIFVAANQQVALNVVHSGGFDLDYVRFSGEFLGALG
jgi:hypothetical protein